MIVKSFEKRDPDARHHKIGWAAAVIQFENGEGKSVEAKVRLRMDTYNRLVLDVIGPGKSPMPGVGCLVLHPQDKTRVVVEVT